MDMINNPWVVGIGGGILSGLLVTFVSRKVFSKRDRREYNQKRLSANREIIYALRPGISEGHMPGPHVVEALISATSRKYGADIHDLFDAAQIGEELTKEIMDSSFISASTKNDYCIQLESLTPKPALAGEAGLLSSRVNARSEARVEEYRSQMISRMSLTLGLMTAIMTVTAVIMDLSDLGTPSTQLNLLRFLVPSAVALAAMGAFPLLHTLRNRLHDLTDKEDEKDDEANSQPNEK